MTREEPVYEIFYSGCQKYKAKNQCESCKENPTIYKDSNISIASDISLSRPQEEIMLLKHGK